MIVINKNTKYKCSLLQNVIEPMAKDGLRTISLAYRDFVPNKADKNQVSKRPIRGLYYTCRPIRNPFLMTIHQSGQVRSQHRGAELGPDGGGKCHRQHDLPLHRRHRGKLSFFLGGFDGLGTNFYCVQDPVRDEVPMAIKQCQRAGITVRRSQSESSVYIVLTNQKPVFTLFLIVLRSLFVCS